MTIFQENDGDGPGFQFTPLTQQYRNDIVELASNSGFPGAAFLAGNTLELTALGANADILGAWDSTQSNLAGYHHIAVTGRDVYVKIVIRGYLFPFGHQATIIAIFERVVLGDPKKASSYADAYVGSKFYVRPLELTKTYPAVGQPWPTTLAGGSRLGTNDFPFQSVTLKTITSPEIDPKLPELVTYQNGNPTVFFDLGAQPQTVGGGPTNVLANAQALLVTSGGTPFPWSFLAVDTVGNELHLQMPLVFVYGYNAIDPEGLVSEFVDWTPGPGHTTPIGNAAWVNAYNNALPAAIRTASGRGQLLRFSPEAGGPAGGTTHPIESITFGATRPSADIFGSMPPTASAGEQTLFMNTQPAFYPAVASARIRLKAADALSGKPSGFNDSAGPGIGISFFPQYVITGLPDTDPPDVPLNGVYAQTLLSGESSGGPLMQFPGNLCGGLGTPNIVTSGLSAISGPVGGALSDLSNYANNAFQNAEDQVKAFFNSLSNAGNLLPQLFGSLGLSDILGSFTDALPGGIPNLTTSTAADGTLTVTYQLQAQLVDTFPSSDPIFESNNGSNPGMFELTATAVIALGKPPTYSVQGSITPFNIYLVGQTSLVFIEVPFNGFTFSAQTGTKTKVQPSVGDVSFIGALSFVNTLEQFLSDLGGSGLSIDVTPTEVDASFSISLPTIAVGMLSLSGIAFSAGVKVPFLGEPALVTFGFATQDNPFTLTVMMFGGGGFLALGIGFAGVQTVQASFEFEGQLSFDIGIASGGISLQAGIYYSYAAKGQPNPGTTITGFVKLSGSLCVLGIITVSIVLDLTLTYVENPQGHYVQGTATLKISVKIIFFSITVPITVTKTFSGGNSAPQGSQARVQREEAAGRARRPDITPPTPPALPATTEPVYFDDIIINAALWQDYCGAFAN